MGDPGVVDRLEGLYEPLGGEPEDGTTEGPVAFHSFLEGFTFDEFHRQVGVGAFGDDLVDLDVAISANPGQSQAFPGQPLLQPGVVGQLGPEDFECYLPSAGIGGRVDHAVSAGTQPSLKGVLVDPFRISRT